MGMLYSWRRDSATRLAMRLWATCGRCFHPLCSSHVSSEPSVTWSMWLVLGCEANTNGIFKLEIL